MASTKPHLSLLRKSILKASKSLPSVGGGYDAGGMTVNGARVGASHSGGQAGQANGSGAGNFPPRQTSMRVAARKKGGLFWLLFFF